MFNTFFCEALKTQTPQDQEDLELEGEKFNRAVLELIKKSAVVFTFVTLFYC